MKPWAFTHPELKTPWHTKATTLEAAKKRFEDCWALRIPQGLLEDVNGSFFDGDVVEVVAAEDDLCPYDMAGHFWQPDERPERVEFVSTVRKPVICVMCQDVAWL